MLITQTLAKNLVPYGYWNSYRVKPFSCTFFVRCVSEGVKSWLWLAYFYVSMATLFGNMQFIYKTCTLHSTDSVICFYLPTWNKLNNKKKVGLRIFPYSVRMRENMDQNNSECGHFSRSVGLYKKIRKTRRKKSAPSLEFLKTFLDSFFTEHLNDCFYILPQNFNKNVLRVDVSDLTCS